MTPKLPEKPRILFLFSDTGGGHRSASEAIIEALNLDYPDQFETRMVDIFRQYAPRPLNYAPDFYPALSRMTDVWTFGYRISDGKRRTRIFYRALKPYIRSAVHKLVNENPCSLVVSVHPLCNVPVGQVVHGKIPYVTVVTDMVSTHAAWFNPQSDIIIVPTEAARQRGLKMGVVGERIKVIGLPIAERYRRPLSDKRILREQLGWAQDRMTVLLVGGGEGMGPLEEVSLALDQSGLPVSLVVICGRNKALRAKLEAHPWKIPAKIYGFVREMPEFMNASDVIVTKAGPGTISEAFIAGLPIILYSRIPGQEEGNVDYVVEEGAGVWAPEPEQVIATLRIWANNPKIREMTASVSKKLARPDASHQIARILAEQVSTHDSL